LDPVSQAVLGGSASLSFAKKSHVIIAVVCGILSGMAPDLDAFIRSDNDPLLYLEFHRQFTHSLVFIPFGALICAVAFRYTFAKRLGFRRTYLYCFLGYATHGLLDACTSYGTQLFWPFSNTRVAWHTISIIDPLFTVPLIVLVVIGVRKSVSTFGRLAIFWAIAYLSFGALQNKRTTTFAEQLASSRNHQPSRLEVKPSFANLFVWKIIYETDERYYVDAVRAGTRFTHYPGVSVEKFNVSRDLAWLENESQQAKDLQRFRWFSNGYLALDQQRPNFVVDMRYSMLPNEVDGLWGIQLERNKTDEEHVDFVWDRNVSKQKRDKLKSMIFD